MLSESWWHLMRQRFCAIEPHCWFPFDFINWHCWRPGFMVWTGVFSSGHLWTSPNFWYLCQSYFSVGSSVLWKKKKKTKNFPCSFLSHIININHLSRFLLDWTRLFPDEFRVFLGVTWRISLCTQCDRVDLPQSCMVFQHYPSKNPQEILSGSQGRDVPHQCHPHGLYFQSFCSANYLFSWG